jgi:hypothetical protein
MDGCVCVVLTSLASAVASMSHVQFAYLEFVYLEYNEYRPTAMPQCGRRDYNSKLESKANNKVMEIVFPLASILNSGTHTI